MPAAVGRGRAAAGAQARAGPRAALAVAATLGLLLRAAGQRSAFAPLGRGAAPPRAARPRRGAPAAAAAAAAPAAGVGCADAECAECGGPGGQYDWFRQWYPIAIPDALDPERQHQMQILGLDVLVWRDEQGAWHVHEQLCPEGQEPPLRGAAFPTKVVFEMLFVFPDRGVDALEAAEKVPLTLPRELTDPDKRDQWTYLLPGGVRDFPCGWDALAENCLDPAHFCAAHHGIIGNRYKDPGVYDYRLTEKIDIAGGFALKGDMGKLEFRPPCLVKFHPNYQSMPFKENVILATYCVPMSPGKFRVVAVVVQNKAKVDGGTIAEKLLTFTNLVPKWVQHLLTPIVVSQDCGLLYYQYRNFREKGYRPTQGIEDSLRFESMVYCPNSIDAGPIAFRRWLRQAGGDVPYACEDKLPMRDIEDIYDIWDAHAKDCRYCTDAFRNLQALKYACVAAFVAAVLFLPAGPERGAVAVAAAALAAGLQWFNTNFRRFPFSHADNNFSAPWM